MSTARPRLLVLLLACGLCPLPSAAHIPETFTNLRVLEGEPTRAELMETMRSSAGGLGVRCNHCDDAIRGIEVGLEVDADDPALRGALDRLRAAQQAPAEPDA